MKGPKTIKGYIKLLRDLEEIYPSEMKGFYNLSVQEQNDLNKLDADISNIINTIKSYEKKH